eukprot:15339352-Ditylum_brightwellii.AAC.1
MDVEAMYPDNFQDFDTWSSNIDHNMEYVAYKAVEFIEENADNDFFLYVNPTAPHSPDVLTAMSKDCRFTVDGDFRSTMSTGWSVEGMTKEFGDDCMLYRANVQERAQSTSTHDLGSIWVDDAVGAIYKALERTSQLDDTVILFQLDHGKAGKDEIWEGGIRIPQFIHYPNGFGTASRTWDGMAQHFSIMPASAKAIHTCTPWMAGPGRMPLTISWVVATTGKPTVVSSSKALRKGPYDVAATSTSS